LIYLEHLPTYNRLDNNLLFKVKSNMKYMSCPQRRPQIPDATPKGKREILLTEKFPFFSHREKTKGAYPLSISSKSSERQGLLAERGASMLSPDQFLLGEEGHFCVIHFPC